MKLKAILDNLDGVDEALKPAYTEKDGKFVLNVEGVAEHPEAKSLKTALEKERQAKKDLQTELDGKPELPEDFNIDEWHRLKDSGSGKIDQRLEDLRKRLNTEKDTAVKKVTDERDTYKGMLTKMATENAINSALGENNITIPAHQKAVRAMFSGDSKVEFENGVPVVTIDNMAVSDKIKSYADSDEGKYFVTASHNGGGGAGGSSGSTVKDYAKMTTTELLSLSKKDPAAKSEMDRRTKIEK